MNCLQPHGRDPMGWELEQKPACLPQLAASALGRPCRQAALGLSAAAQSWKEEALCLKAVILT